MYSKNKYKNLGFKLVLSFLLIFVLNGTAFATTPFISELLGDESGENGSIRTWTCPADVTQIMVELWGGGGGSAISEGVDMGTGGGGGGAYASKIFDVTPGATYTYYVGLGGNAGVVGSTAASDGGTTYWVSESVLKAYGGRCSSPSPGLGGRATTGIPGVTSFKGGDGGYGYNGTRLGGGGGGGAAGSTGPGESASFVYGGNGAGDFSGDGASGSLFEPPATHKDTYGKFGNNYGGGASGPTSVTQSMHGAPGGKGLIRITNMTADFQAPTVSALSPADNATNLGVNINLVVTFSEDVTVGTGNIVIKKAADDSIIETIAVTSVQVTGGGTSTITINPSVTLESKTGYYVQIAATAFEDAAGNSYAGIGNTTSWNFTTADVQAPTVSALSPVDNGTNIALNSNLVLTFSEDVIVGTGDILIKKTADDSIIETIDVTSVWVTGGGTSTITINPYVTLESKTGYYVQIAATAFNDAAGNNYAGIGDKTSWNFTTADVQAPAISALSPADNGTNLGVDITLVMTFSEDVIVGTGDIVIKKATDDSIIETIDVTSAQVIGGGTSTITINPSVTLGSETGYYVQIAATAFDDAAGNSYAGIGNKTSWNFTTADVQVPTVSALSPGDNDTNIVGYSNLVVTFSEAVIVGTGDILIKKGADDSIIETIDVTSEQVTGGGTSTITINPSVTLESETGYYVQIAATAFEDAAGNCYSGIGDTTSWNFTTSKPSSGVTIRTTTLDLTSTSLSYNATDSTTKTVNATTTNIVDSSEGWSWVYSTKTLTLNDVNIQVASGGLESSYGIKLPECSIITLEAGSVNNVRAADVSSFNKSSYGISFDVITNDPDGVIITNIINGAGTLHVNGGSATGGAFANSCGIGTSGDSPYGNIEITNGTIYAAGGTANWNSMGIYAGQNITISGGTVTATGGTGKYSSGLNTANQDVTISGGTVTATGGSATEISKGISANGGFLIDSGKVNATGGNVTGLSGKSGGISANNRDIMINGGKIKATGGMAPLESHGIYSRANSVIFNGGTTYANSGASTTTHAVYSGSALLSFGIPVNTSIVSPAGAGISSDKKFIATVADGTTDVTNVLIQPLTVISGTPTIAVANGYGVSSDQIKIDAVLTATPNITPHTNLSYQWEVSADGTTWADATGIGNTTAIYTVTAADVAKYLRVKVDSADAAGSGYSAASGQVPYTISLVRSGHTNTDAVSFNDSSPVTITYLTDGNVRVYYTLDSSGNLSNTLSYTGGTITQVTTPGTSYSTYTVNSGDALNGIIIIRATFAHLNRTSPGGSGSGSSSSSDGTLIIVNGKSQTMGTTATSTVNGQTTTMVTVDSTRLANMLETQSDNATVTISFTNNPDVAAGVLTGQTIKNMESKEAVLEIKTGHVTYTLPAEQINIDSITEQLGQNVELKDIKVNISISQPSQDIVRIVEATANQNHYQIVVNPIEFNITCTSGDKTIDVSQFNSFIERTIAIPDGVDPSQITTCVVLNKVGTFSHVPTTIVLIDGKYYAKIKSLTNSSYLVIYNPKTFVDVEQHWAKDYVNEMGSRLVVRGIDASNFVPDQEITRAEFTAIVIRSLGLTEADKSNQFNDVKDSDWFSGSVAKAAEYGIVNGMGDGTFMPNQAITRQEAVVMIAKAMEIAGMDTTLSEADISTQLSRFHDSNSISEWARAATAKCTKLEIMVGSNGSLRLQSNITRAETATVVMKMLKKAGLI